MYLCVSWSETKSDRDAFGSGLYLCADIYLEKPPGNFVWKPTNICMCTCSLDPCERLSQGSQSGFHLWHLRERALVPFTSLKGLYPVICRPRENLRTIFNVIVGSHRLLCVREFKGRKIIRITIEEYLYQNENFNFVSAFAHAKVNTKKESCLTSVSHLWSPISLVQFVKPFFFCILFFALSRLFRKFHRKLTKILFVPIKYDIIRDWKTFSDGKYIYGNIGRARCFSISLSLCAPLCMPRDTLERIRNKSKSDFLFRTVDIRLINLRGSADDCAYKSSAIGLAARIERARCIYLKRDSGGREKNTRDSHRKIERCFMVIYLDSHLPPASLKNLRY